LTHNRKPGQSLAKASLHPGFLAVSETGFGFQNQASELVGIFVHLYSGYYLCHNVQEVAGLFMQFFPAILQNLCNFASDRLLDPMHTNRYTYQL
jgi:hypothetical protein